MYGLSYLYSAHGAFISKGAVCSEEHRALTKGVMVNNFEGAILNDVCVYDYISLSRGTAGPEHFLSRTSGKRTHSNAHGAKERKKTCIHGAHAKANERRELLAKNATPLGDEKCGRAGTL